MATKDKYPDPLIIDAINCAVKNATKNSTGRVAPMDVFVEMFGCAFGKRKNRVSVPEKIYIMRRIGCLLAEQYPIVWESRTSKAFDITRNISLN
jgi:hypothetical protein